MISLMRITLSAAAFASLSLPLPASAAEPEACPGLVASRETLFSQAALRQDEVGLTFVGHATFLIETPQGVRIATDYSDGTRPPVTPEVATMNKAHSTHFSTRPDPGITHVLKGWDPAGGPASHDLTVQDVRIRNVSTNIRSFGGATEYDGNSIFVFETAQLCIAHLGHLHHTLTPEHLKKLGRIDVLLVPVDGGYTLETFDIMEVLRSINAPLMVPMHFSSAHPRSTVSWHRRGSTSRSSSAAQPRSLCLARRFPTARRSSCCPDTEGLVRILEAGAADS
jgi:L-ascorbate metabolism protein UlaG (beta-lactamase superfamily)